MDWFCNVFKEWPNCVFFNDQAFQSLGGTGNGANFYDVESHDDYWISGVKKRGSNRHPRAPTASALIDQIAVEAYLEHTGLTQLPREFEVVTLRRL